MPVAQIESARARLGRDRAVNVEVDRAGAHDFVFWNRALPKLFAVMEARFARPEREDIEQTSPPDAGVQFGDM